MGQQHVRRGFTPPKPRENPEPYMNSISPNYFATLGVPIVPDAIFRSNDTTVKHGPEVWNWTPTGRHDQRKKIRQKFFPGRIPSALHWLGIDPGTPSTWKSSASQGFQVHQSPRRNPRAGFHSLSWAPPTREMNRLPPHHCRSQSMMTAVRSKVRDMVPSPIYACVPPKFRSTTPFPPSA